MKIALIRQRYTAWGGAENTLDYLVQEFLRQGHEVTILSTTGQGKTSAEGHSGQLRWLPVPAWGGKSGRVLSFALNTRRLLQKEHFDVIYSLERTLDQDVYRAGDGCHREWLIRRWPYATGGQRLSMTISPFHRLLLGLEKRLFQSACLRRVISNSQQVRDEIERHYGVDPTKIRVIYNGVDRERFSPAAVKDLRTAVAQELGLSPLPPIILFVGSGFGRKGLAFLIKAVARLRDSRNLLLVVGQGRPGSYQRLARKSGVASRVRFLGPQPRVERFYAAAAVVALPTIYDPCSNVVLEALACGRPVVTTAANGAAEFITPEENGVILGRPDDLEGLAAALARFTESRDDRRIQDAAVAAVADLSWRRTAQETLDALTAVAAEKHPG
ncbi:MAG: glycosyltransferase family 4 protein [Deltaproteobacteria bacterium]|nr:glycosyltransferase family 4 protein [Deltaproteobacteria bacterium]